jgi:uncharacterized protein
MNKPQHGTIENRTALAGSIRTDDSKFQLSGIAAAYNSLSQNLGGFKEKIAPGAFSRSLREKADVKALFNHDPSKILGRTKSGTLVLSDSPEGLRWVCQLDRTNSDHVNVYSAVKRGDLSECSFAFTVPAGGDQWDDSDGSDPAVHAIRTLRDVNLMDVSCVAYPAYAQGTAVGARARKPGAVVPPAVNTVKLADACRRHCAEVLGKMISEQDARALAAEDVSSLVRNALTKALAGMPHAHTYVMHDADHCYSIPTDHDPDEESSARVAKWQYFINDKGEVELKAARYNAEENPEGPDVEVKAIPVRISLREQNILRMRMRQSAGIFYRR